MQSSPHHTALVHAGSFGYWATVVFQQIASIGNNIAIQILAGQSMWTVYNQYSSNPTVTLQEFIIIFGAFELLLSQLPDIHSLRAVNLFCTACTVAFTACVVGLSAKYGGSPQAAHCSEKTLTLSLCAQ